MIIEVVICEALLVKHLSNNMKFDGTCSSPVPSNNRPSAPVSVAEALSGEGFPAEDLSPVLDHDLDDDVGELDVHDGGHGLLLGAQQGGAEADALQPAHSLTLEQPCLVSQITRQMVN